MRELRKKVLKNEQEKKWNRHGYDKCGKAIEDLTERRDEAETGQKVVAKKRTCCQTKRKCCRNAKQSNEKTWTDTEKEKGQIMVSQWKQEMK